MYFMCYYVGDSTLIKAVVLAPQHEGKTYERLHVMSHLVESIIQTNLFPVLVVSTV